MSSSKRTNWIWPSITDTASARKAAKQGFWASLYCGGATLLIVILNIFGVQLFDFTPWALVDAVLFGIICWGLHKMSRTAAVLGLLLYMFERIDMWSRYGGVGIAMAIIITLMFINSIRGTFAFHNLKVPETSPQST